MADIVVTGNGITTQVSLTTQTLSTVLTPISVSVNGQSPVTLTLSPTTLALISQSGGNINLGFTNSPINLSVSMGGGTVTIPQLLNPVYSYNGDGTLALVTYDGGSTKAFGYTSGVLTTEIFIWIGQYTKTRTFHYTSGVLTSITEVLS